MPSGIAEMVLMPIVAAGTPSPRPQVRSLAMPDRGDHGITKCRAQTIPVPGGSQVLDEEVGVNAGSAPPDPGRRGVLLTGR